MAHPPMVNINVLYPGFGGTVPSYFDLKVNSGPNPSPLPTGTFDGWCADTSTGLNTGASGVNLDAEVYATTGISGATANMCHIEQPWNFDSVNWLLNQNFSSGPTYTLAEVQAAVWVLLGDSYLNQPSIGTHWTAANIDALVNMALTQGNNYVPDITDSNPNNDNITVLLAPFLDNNHNGYKDCGDTAQQCIVTTVKSAALGDYVWYDCDKDGKQDSNEHGVAGVTVKLIGGGDDGKVNGVGDIVLNTTTTDASGHYKFVGLNPGFEYQVQFVAPNGYDFTTRDAGSNDTIDSDASQSTGKTQVVTLAAGEFNTSLDAGLVKDCGGWGGGYGGSNWGGGCFGGSDWGGGCNGYQPPTCDAGWLW